MLRQFHTRCTMYLLKILVPINLLYTGGQVTHKKFFFYWQQQEIITRGIRKTFITISILFLLQCGCPIGRSHYVWKKNFKQNTLRLVCKGWETIELVKTPRIALFSILVQNECSIEKWGPCLGVIYKPCGLTMERERKYIL